VHDLQAVEQLQQAQQLCRHVDGDGFHDAPVRVLKEEPINCYLRYLNN
jgi:hypothetical protein